MSMGILNGLMKFVEPAAGEILKNVAIGLLDINGETKNESSGNSDYLQPVIDGAVSAVSSIAVNELKKVTKNPNLDFSEYEVAKLEKYKYTF